MRKDQKKVSRARRHFFYAVGALASAAALSALSKSAKAKIRGPTFGKDFPHCILRGTHIQTCSGTERVEKLAIGDRVVTSRGEGKPIKWIGRQRFSLGASSRWPECVHPIRVARSALADNVPHADLYLSPMHAVLINGALIEVKDLVNGTSIAPAVPERTRDIEYFHIELATHEVILAEGAAVETLLVTDGRERFSNFVEYERSYGRDAGPPMVEYAPVLRYASVCAHLKGLLRLGISQIVDVRDPIQVAYDRIAARAAKGSSVVGC
jgi:hypothetical protein